MSVTIKSEHEIELMREAGRILSIVHQEMEKIIRPGISTMDINRKGEEVIRSYDCIPSFLNYQGYPASICVSVNDEVVHGFPSRMRIRKVGDIVSLASSLQTQAIPCLRFPRQFRIMPRQTDMELFVIWLVMVWEKIFTRIHRFQTTSQLAEA